MRIDQEINKSAKPYHMRSPKTERTFDLSLTTTVSGVDANDNEFEESTELSSISSQEAVFWLKNKVTIGSKLVLSLNVPKTLILENQLNLIVSGEVVFASSDPSHHNHQLISIQLDKLYKIQPIYSSK